MLSFIEKKKKTGEKTILLCIVFFTPAKNYIAVSLKSYTYAVYTRLVPILNLLVGRGQPRYISGGRIVFQVPAGLGTALVLACTQRTSGRRVGVRRGRNEK